MPKITFVDFIGTPRTVDAENGATVMTVACTYTASGNRLDVAVAVSHPMLSNPVRVEMSRFVPSF